ncbi:MAG TPA: exodeoxyribonuclease VII large subunit [Candidatus Hungatella pullicola]|nr:exodeoxyribonuclease VII large subunit [Candidatus Hungatella pullicola]
MAGAYSVSQVNAYIKNMFAQDFVLSRISVKGEVSNCKYHTSGHIYFTLKDKTAAISAVMFAGQRRGLSFRLEEGQQVIVKGSVEVYERDGRYQLYAQEISREGIGDLFERFQKLKSQLEEMGMFAPEYKRPIPRFARTVGIVTASTGAAIRDIMNIAARRNPYVQLILYPALVQGEQAKYSIAKGIETLDAMGLDVLIVGRGGGSIEDLWAFNEEMVARAIFACNTPVISAVGHETDVTIADYVADMRAPTPSAAAELAVFDYCQFENQLLGCQEALRKAMDRRLEMRRYQTQQLRLRLQLHDPRRQIRENRQRLADSEEKLRAVMVSRIQADRARTDQMGKKIQDLMEKQAVRDRHRLNLIASRLDGLSPLKKIGGGYGFLTDGRGLPLESVSQVRKGEAIGIRLGDGKITAQVSECFPDRKKPGKQRKEKEDGCQER